MRSWRARSDREQLGGASRRTRGRFVNEAGRARAPPCGWAPARTAARIPGKNPHRPAEPAPDRPGQAPALGLARGVLFPPSMMTFQDGHSSTKSNRRASRSHSRNKPSTGAALVLGLFTALVAPKTALADEPAAPPASPPPATPTAPAPAAEPARATPAAAPAKPLPLSILAMQGHDVVLRLDSGARLEGHLISASPEGFELRRLDGVTVRIPRREVRGVRLAGTADSERESQAAMPPDVGSTPPDFWFPKRERSAGFGTAFGGGFSSAGDGMAGAFLLPTAELQIFLPREYSIDVTMPVLNIALLSALTGGLWLAGDLYFNVNAGQGELRFVAGPGVGFAHASAQGSKVTSLKIPFQIGLESLSKKRTFGLKLLARPWFEIADTGYSSATGGGLIGALVFSGYSLSDRGGQ